MQLDREYFLRMMKGRSAGAVVVEGSEGGGGGVTLGPLLASLNAVAMPTAEGYLHWTGSAWEFPSIDLSSYATQQWVLQQGYITSSAISDMATETWVGQQGFATTSQLSHYLALTGGTMEDSIITPGSDSYGIYPETDRYGFIGKSTNWYWNIYGSRLYAEKMELYVYSSGSRSLYGGIDNNNFYLYPGTNSYKFNVDSNGYVTAQKFVKDGGTSSQFLKADGSSSALSASDIPDISATYATKTWVGQHFSHGHSVHGGLTSGHLVVGDNDFSRWDMPFTFDPADGGTVIPAFLPLSGGILSSTLEIATGGDRKLVLNNTDNELWNVISFQDNGTEVGYLGLCGSNALAWNQHDILLAGYDNNLINHDNEFNFVSAGFGGDVIQFPDGDDVWFNYRTASGNLDGNISSYKFGDGKGGVLAVISNGQFSGNAASAGALKYSGTAKVSAQNDGALVDGYLHIGNVSVAEGGSFTYYPTITFGDYNGMDVYIQEDSEDHMTIRASAGITLLDATTINDSLHFSPTVSGYDCQVGMYLSSTLFNFVSINGQQSISGYKFDAEVQAPSFKKTGSSDDNVLLGGGGTKAVSDFVLNNANQIVAKTFGVLNSNNTNGVYIHWDGNGYLNINGDTAAPRGYVFDAPVTQSSDIRLKDIIRDEAFDAESIAKMPLVTYSWKKDEEKRKHFGTIAQNWEKVIPEVVSEAPDGMKAMDYGAAAMAAGVTACREVVALKKDIAKLEEIINQLKQ